MKSSNIYPAGHVDLFTHRWGSSPFKSSHKRAPRAFTHISACDIFTGKSWMGMMATAEDILRFWFEEIEPEQQFEKDLAFDEMICSRFGATFEAAAAGELDHWENEPRSCLALVILLDQFSRNMFRDSPRMYETDAKVLALAKRAVEDGGYKSLPQDQQRFLFLPYEHSEDLEDQRICMELMDTLDDKRNLEYARNHLVIVERFGRFPHRNAILGRTSSPEETEFLKEPNSSF
jgi:uncharacterized protein (DUF924 family)